MNRHLFAFCLFIFLIGNVFAEEVYFEKVKDLSTSMLAEKFGKQKASELVLVRIESVNFLGSNGTFALFNKAIFVAPETETQRAPKENTPLNIETRMAELQARTHEGSSPTIFQYKAYTVLTGKRTKISEEIYESFFQIKKQP